jgi:DMSO/TMAO reductase YedYZ molybdopterin-dependent catalytic subunit
LSLFHSPEPKKEIVHRNARAWVPLLFAAVVGLLLSAASNVGAQVAQATATVTEPRIDGEVSTPLVLSVADLKKMPRKTLSIVNPHDNKTETYEGVLLEELLKRAGVAQGEKLRGALMATYLIAEAEDGYRVVFSLAELDSGILDADVIVADTMNGESLAPKQGPFRVGAPHEKRPARWVRMLKSITVVRAPAQ